MDANLPLDIPLIEEDFEISFRENLQAFQDTVPRYMKNKKAHRQKKKVKKDSKFLFFLISNIYQSFNLSTIIQDLKKIFKLYNKKNFLY